MPQKGFAAILIIIPIVVILAVASFFIFSQKHISSSIPNFKNFTNSDAFMRHYGGSCQDRPVSFTASPMNINQLGFIKSLGMVSDGHVTPIDHLYFLAIDQNAADNTYPVFMPADGTVIQIQEMPAQYIGDRKDVKAATEDHFIVISHSCRYFSIFIHIHKLAPALTAAAGSLKPEESKSVKVDLKAGEMLGYIKTSYDWIPVDTQNTLSGFIHPQFYTSEPWKIHVFDPFTLFSGELKNSLLAKNLRNIEPRSGKIDYDQPGKLIGNWFKEGSGGYAGPSGQEGKDPYWHGHLSVVPDYIDPNSTVMSTGDWDGVAKQFAVKGKVNPAEVNANSGMVKYELLELMYLTGSGSGWSDQTGFATGIHPSQDSNLIGTMALQVLPGEELKVEKFPGKTANQVAGFTEKAQIYER